MSNVRYSPRDAVEVSINKGDLFWRLEINYLLTFYPITRVFIVGEIRRVCVIHNYELVLSL